MILSAPIPKERCNHSREWQEIVAATFNYPSWHLCAREQDGSLCGILSIVRITSRLFGDFMLSLPYVNYCGSLATSTAADRLLLQRACEIAADQGVSHVEFRDRHARGRGLGCAHGQD